MSDLSTAAMDLLFSVGVIIRERKRIPSGHLYALVMGKLSLSEYEAVIQALKRTGLIKESHSHMLIWVGGETIQ